MMYQLHVFMDKDKQLSSTTHHSTKLSVYMAAVDIFVCVQVHSLLHFVMLLYAHIQELICAN